MSTSYVVSLSTGNDPENNTFRNVGTAFKPAEKAFDNAVSRYAKVGGGPFTVSLVKINPDDQSAKILKETVVGAVA